MGSMEEFVHYANLIFVKRQLADPSITDEHRRILARLVALEQAKRFDEKDDGHAERKPDLVKAGLERASAPLPVSRSSSAIATTTVATKISA